ncbi:MAG: peptide deformylase [Alphaproteobacteria bacterium]|nr:MAG: peptide deformylase [Alphaproteobacteria bacterium]
MATLHYVSQNNHPPNHRSLHPAIVDCSHNSLRETSKPIDLNNRSEAEQVWRKMESIMEELRTIHDFRNSLGLSAIQIGIPLRMCIIWTPQRGYIHMANPEILEASAQVSSEYEGCLSFFDVRGRVARPYGILTRYLQKDFTTKEQAFTSWSARIIQHEIDHMNGIIYTDRMQAGERPIAYEDYLVLKMAG